MWLVVEPLLVIFVAVFVITQILWPALTNKPLFNLFRFRKEDKEKSKVILDLEKKKEREEIEKLKEELK